MFKYYLKKVSNQDVKKTTVVNTDAEVAFFGISIPNKDDSATITIKYLPDNVIDTGVKIIKKQDIRIFIDRKRFKEGDILLFEKTENGDFLLCVKNSYDSDYSIINSSLKSNYLLTDVIPCITMVNANKIEFKRTKNKGIGFDNLKEDFATWFINIDGTKHNYFTDSFASNRDKLIEQLTKYEKIYIDVFGTPVFSLPDNEVKEFIEEIEKNLYLESGDFFLFSLKTSHHMPRAILGKKNYIKFLKELLIRSKTSSAVSPKVEPINKIYFGAPGTGKSFRITEDLINVNEIFQKRITFHPEYDNASFVGGYKPITNDGDIKYEFVPQIFTNIYVEACNDPSHQYYLIIEEINRGNCAEIFGELFQLLDRDINYKITPSNELINYLNNNISNSIFYSEGKMLLPSNLSILATMNTSDQSLFPMDSAFKRRWEWEYIPISYNTDSSVNKSALYKIKIGNTIIDWISFIESINKKIQLNRNLGMDKCIGNYFVKPNLNNEIVLDKFIYKILFYLWNDVFKDEPKDSIFGDKNYQDFFPIETNGENLVIKMLEDLKIINSKHTSDQTQPEA